MENKIIGVDRMVLTRRKVIVLLLSLVFLLSMAQVSMASGVIIPTNTTKDTSYESFFIYPGESYSFTNTGEEEAGILLGSDGVASYVIEYYDENGDYLFEDAYFMDGYGGPGMLPKEKVIVSVEANSPNPLNIDNYSISLEIEKLASEEQSTPPLDVEDPKTEQEQEQEQGTSLNQSTIKLNSWEQFDTSHGIHYTLKNGTDSVDTNNFAMIFLMNEGGKYGFNSEIHFFEDIVLNPGEEHKDLVYSQFFAPSVLKSNIKAVLVKFENNDELEEMKSSVPPNDHVNNAYGIETAIDQGEEGKQWFKDNFNIDIK
jgi:hypothetical protein